MYTPSDMAIQTSIALVQLYMAADTSIWGERKIFSFYSDLALGAAFVTDLEGAYWVDPVDGVTKKEDISVDKGDVQFYISWQPGIRVRCYKNLHIFLGPTLSSHCLGVHLGIGF